MTRRRCWCACGCRTAPATRAASGPTTPCSRCVWRVPACAGWGLPAGGLQAWSITVHRCKASLLFSIWICRYSPGDSGTLTPGPAGAQLAAVTRRLPAVESLPLEPGAELPAPGKTACQVQLGNATHLQQVPGPTSRRPVLFCTDGTNTSVHKHVTSCAGKVFSTGFSSGVHMSKRNTCRVLAAGAGPERDRDCCRRGAEPQAGGAVCSGELGRRL